MRTVEAGQLFGATLVTTRLEYYPGMAVAGSECEVMFFDMAKYAVELVWRGDKLFAGHVTRTWKGPDPKTGKPVSKTAFGTAEVK